jgi:2-polyprenyl-3-methyl-5-hydroxy-6-metoxy-1,4-benzoquinol methylase
MKMDDEILKQERMYATSIHDALIDHHERYEFALNFIANGQVVLDAACGCGYGTGLMAKQTSTGKIVGVDRSVHALQWAQKYFLHDNTIYIHADMDQDFQKALPVREYDVITCFETVEHMKQDHLFISKLYSLLKPTGILLISAPNEAVFPHLDNPFFPGRVNPHHYRHYHPHELERLMAEQGFKVVGHYTQQLQEQQVLPGRGGFVTVLSCCK